MAFDIDQLVERAKAHIAAKGDQGREDILARAAHCEFLLFRAAETGNPQHLNGIAPGIDAMTARSAIAALIELCE